MLLSQEIKFIDRFGSGFRGSLYDNLNSNLESILLYKLEDNIISRLSVDLGDNLGTVTDSNLQNEKT